MILDPRVPTWWDATLLIECQYLNPRGAPVPQPMLCRTVDAALRRSIPATNQDVRQVQRSLEDISFKLRIPQRKPWQQMTDDIVKATSIVNNESKVV